MTRQATWGAREIRALKRQTGLTIEQFAHALGVTAKTVARWLSGESEPSPLAIEKLGALERRVAA